nr:MAG: hypothetical protein [Lokiarchaeota virus Ratatoskr Meg22_1012]
MNGKYHLLINTIGGVFLFLYCVFAYILSILSPLLDYIFPISNQSWSDTPGIIFSFIASFAWCDIDQHVSWLTHRNWFTHSILISIPLLFIPLWWWQFTAGVFTFFVGLHLVCDCIKDPKKQKGYWNVAITKKKRMNRWQSLLWLEINGWVGIILGLMVMLI